MLPLETTVNLKSASFVVIMFLHKGLIHIQSQIKPRLLFGENVALTPASWAHKLFSSLDKVPLIEGLRTEVVPTVRTVKLTEAMGW